MAIRIDDLPKYSEAFPFFTNEWTPGAVPRIVNVEKVSEDVADMVARLWPDPSAMGQRFVDQSPWGQNITLLTKAEDAEERLLYAARAVEHRRSRPLLTHHIFDFLSLGYEAEERAIEAALISHITKFLLELGAGFAFVGRQVALEVGGRDFYVDLRFYHRGRPRVRLQRHVGW